MQARVRFAAAAVTTTSSVTPRPTDDVRAALVRVSEAWAEIEVDRERKLVYSPRLGRLYLLPSDFAADATFLSVTGLAAIPHFDALVDPAGCITHDQPGLAGTPEPAVSAWLQLCYAFMRVSRHWTTLRVAARMVRRAAVAFGHDVVPPGATASEIGRLVAAAERGSKKGDCYARALLTVFLCLSAGRACVLAVGVLAPTRKMHAWCSVDGELPYEPFPEHFLYQPVWTLELAP